MRERGGRGRTRYHFFEERRKAFALLLFFLLSFFLSVSLSSPSFSKMGTGASRLVGGGAQGASMADDNGAALTAAGNGEDPNNAQEGDKARLPATATTPSSPAPLSEEDRASAVAAAAVASAFGLENFGNTCYCNSVLQVRERKRKNRGEKKREERRWMMRSI